MVDRVDVLFINPGDSKQIYQDLGDEFSAINPLCLSGYLELMSAKRVIVRPFMTRPVGRV